MTLATPTHCEFQTEVEGFDKTNPSTFRGSVTRRSPQANRSFKSFGATDISNMQEDDSVSPEIEVRASRILSEIPGIILAVKESEVHVKLSERSLVAMPAEIFENKSIIRSGQHIRYQIRKDEYGYRRQQIVADEAVAPADNSDLLRILADI